MSEVVNLFEGGAVLKRIILSFLALIIAVTPFSNVLATSED